MRAGLLICMSVALVADRSIAQVPIDPIWSRIVPSSSHVTKLALDHGTDRLHLAFQPAPTDAHTHIRAFNTDGSDVPPPYTELTLGTLLPATYTTGYPLYSDGPLRLLAQSDTLYSIDHYLDQLDGVSWYRSARIAVDSATTFSMHTGSGPQVDVHHDQFGDITVSPTVIRNFSNHHWLMGRAIVPTTDRIAADESRIYCGRVPNITTMDRSSMTLLSPLVVPSSGSSTRTLIMLTNDVINYASVNSNLTMDIGAVDTTGALLWSAVVNLPGTTSLTGIVGDAHGNVWVSGSQNTSPQSGVVYRFSSSGAQTGNYLFGRTIDDIVCSGDTVFLSGWDAVDPTMVYLAAFATDMTTAIGADGRSQLRIYPNPASTEIRVDGLSPGTSRLIIADVAGRFVKEVMGPFSGSMSIPVTDLPNGTYVLRCSGAGATAIRSFSVLR
ncbi:MAG: T9SS type A sorting domain-containing protein [Flavobacteriales bacterium]|nr:T9SS type A sorting domain-containing protein [Flavobacteriales bacterium]